MVTNTGDVSLTVGSHGHHLQQHAFLIDQLSLLHIHRVWNSFVLNVIVLCSLTDGVFLQSSPYLLLQRWTQRARCHHFHQRTEDFISERCQHRHQKGQQTEHSRAKGKRGPDPHGCSGGDRPLTTPAGAKVMSDLLLKGASTDTPFPCGRRPVAPNLQENSRFALKAKTVQMLLKQCSASTSAFTFSL